MQISLKGKYALISGATRGIGYITARELARMGADVTLIGRDHGRVQAAVDSIRRETGNQQVHPITADLSQRSGVLSTAHEFRQYSDRLDVLINNAGAIYMKRETNPDGIEMTFALNHLNYQHLTLTLLPQLQNSSSPRVINVSSAAHFGGVIHFDDLEQKRGYTGWKAYSASKLMNVLFTYELARRYPSIQANALHPGFVATNFGRSNGGLFDLVFRLSQVAAISPEEGAKTSIHLATSPAVEGISGKYWSNVKETPSSDASYNRETAHRLWEVSSEMINLSVHSG